MVDAGTSGWRNFPVFKKQVIDRSQTRILAFLNIAGSGMTGFPSEEDINDMDPHMTSLVIQQYPDNNSRCENRPLPGQRMDSLWTGQLRPVA